MKFSLMKVRVNVLLISAKDVMLNLNNVNFDVF